MASMHDDEEPRRGRDDEEDSGQEGKSTKDGRRSGGNGESDDEEIEILEFSAADEAGVRLPDPEIDLVVEDDEPEERPRRSDRSSDEPSGRDGEALVAARAQASDLREQLLRTAADFENYRKRLERERTEEKKQATAGLVRGLVPVLDSFRRAMDQAGKAEDNAALAGFLDGVRLIETQLFDILRAAGLEPVDAEGAFDPSHHEALMQEPSTAAPHLSILEVYEPGYKLGGRLLRPARVKVAYNPAGESGHGQGGDGEGEGDEAT